MSSLSSGNTLFASGKSDKSIKRKDATSEKSSLTAFNPLDDKNAATTSKKGSMPPTAAVRSSIFGGMRAKKGAIKKEVLQSAAEAVVICIE